ncbi:unnamed protein product [Rotaria sordida]|uniref:Uncharacterized protein n=1 Tax=Rotaria sordida TaxID=392033 RepID=A0A814ZJ42_9BILA|nr:unnamed protein product [Rotaria sordida]
MMKEIEYNEGFIIHGQHLLIVEPPASSTRYHHVASQFLNIHAIGIFSLTQQDYNSYSAAYCQIWLTLANTLSLYVYLLTLD